MKVLSTAIGLAVLCSLTTAPAWALFETNKELSDKARISMVEAIKAAEKSVQGKPVEVNMGKDEGRVVYKVEIIDANKKSHTVYVDAADGKIHEVK
jgi:uncharacterized membrane protein YkoI